jgi:hypothetical protein
VQPERLPCVVVAAAGGGGGDDDAAVEEDEVHEPAGDGLVEDVDDEVAPGVVAFVDGGAHVTQAEAVAARDCGPRPLGETRRLRFALVKWQCHCFQHRYLKDWKELEIPVTKEIDLTPTREIAYLKSKVIPFGAGLPSSSKYSAKRSTSKGSLPSISQAGGSPGEVPVDLLFAEANMGALTWCPDILIFFRPALRGRLSVETKRRKITKGEENVLVSKMLWYWLMLNHHHHHVSRHVSYDITIL